MSQVNPTIQVILCAAAWATMCTRLVAQQIEPVPEPYIEASGTVRGLELLPGEDEGAGGIDFCFHFKPDSQDREWFVISRGSTPFEVFRLGPTYVRVDKTSMADGVRIWLLGVKTVDRIPATFHKKFLPPDSTITVLLITQLPGANGEAGEPVYVNNWFHPWRKDKGGMPIEGIMDHYVTRFYNDRKDPFWVCGWLPANTSSPDRAKRLAEVRHLLEDTDIEAIAAQPFKKGVYRGYLVGDKTRPLGFKLMITQFWRHVPHTGGYRLIIGNDKGLERLP